MKTRDLINKALELACSYPTIEEMIVFQSEMQSTMQKIRNLKNFRVHNQLYEASRCAFNRWFILAYGETVE